MSIIELALALRVVALLCPPRPVVRYLGRNINPYCYNGNWHIKYTEDISEVTCEECLKRKRE